MREQWCPGRFSLPRKNGLGTRLTLLPARAPFLPDHKSEAFHRESWITAPRVSCSRTFLQVCTFSCLYSLYVRENSGQQKWGARRQRLPGIRYTSLVPRPFLRGRGKTAWAPLLAHARRSHKNMGIRARLYIVRLHISNLP